MPLKKFRSLPAEVRFAEPKAGAAPVAELVEVLRTGSFKHPEYGSFEITREHVLAFVENHKAKVRGIDIAVDFSHQSEGVAAGWMKTLSASDNDKGGVSLLAEVDWTPTALESLQKKEFRYLSGDFTLDYVGEENGKHFGPTLLGAGLTNRPFIKGMDPVVQLSERKEGDSMNEQEKKELQDAKDAAAKAAKDLEAANLKLSESQKLVDAQKAKDEQAAKDAKIAEKKSKFDKMLSEKKVVEAQREPFMSGDSEKFMELAQPAPKDTQLSETSGGAGGATGATGGEKDAEDQILELAEKIEKEQKVDNAKAISLVLADPANKKLRDSYEAKFK